MKRKKSCFTEKEREFLLENRNKMPLKEIAQKLSRTRAQVYCFYYNRGLRLPKQYDPNKPTPRELEVLKHLYLGTDGISKSLVITRTTVRSHLDNLMSKLGANNRIEMILIALKKGIVTLDDFVETKER